MRVRLLKPLCFGGAKKPAGTVLDLPDHEAREVLYRGVAERAEVAPPPAAGPMTTESVPDLVAGKAVKGAKNAGK